MNRAIRKKLAKLFGGKVSVLAGAQLTPAERTAFVQKDLADHHTLLVGGTRKGKSGALELIAQSCLTRGDDGITAIDPHGSFVRALRDWCANPANGQHGRALHYLDPSSSYTFGFNPVRPYDASWEACHDAAVTLTSVIESRFEASAEETPRLARIVYVAAMLCARHGLTLLELLEFLSIGGDELRRSLLQDFDNRIVRRELEDLQTLASKSPREFLSLVESTKNRFVRWLGDRRLARILGQPKGLDPLAVMDGRELVFADFSSLTYSDAAFLGCLINSMYFAAARRRSPLQGPRHRIFLDEAESLVTLDVARACDQCAKYGFFLTAAIQRLGQLRARGDFIADALLTNCSVKICFGGLEPESARYMAESLYAGHLNLSEWKPGTERPVAVGNEKVTLRNRSRAQHRAQHSGHATTDMTSIGRMSASSDAAMSAWVSGSTDSQSASLLSTPPAPFPFDGPSQLSQSAGQSHGRTSSASGGRSSARSSARHTARARGSSVSHAAAHGASIAEGESEAFVTRYEWLPHSTFTLEEQLFRATSALMNLPRRECIVKVEDQAPYRTRTPELTPAFKSAEFKAEMLPRYLDNAARRSPYLVPAETIDAEIAGRVAQLNRPVPDEPEPDFAAPEPLPTIIDNPVDFAAAFMRRRSPAAPRPEKPELRVIEGGASDGDNQS